MDLHAEGMRMRLPRAWEGRIRRNPARTQSRQGAGMQPQASDGDHAADSDQAADRGVEEDQLPVAQLGNFVLPAALDDFGAQAVEVMETGNCFLALLEYGPEEAESALFSGPLPRRLRLEDFSPRQLQRQLPDQLGTQVFATEGGRAFCLYVVLAGRARAAETLRTVNEVLSSLELEPR